MAIHLTWRQILRRFLPHQQHRQHCIIIWKQIKIHFICTIHFDQIYCARKLGSATRFYISRLTMNRTGFGIVRFLSRKFYSSWDTSALAVDTSYVDLSNTGFYFTSNLFKILGPILLFFFFLLQPASPITVTVTQNTQQKLLISRQLLGACENRSAV